MGAVISAVFSRLFSCCVKSAEHEVNIALGRCNTCNRLPNVEGDATDTEEKCPKCQKKE